MMREIQRFCLGKSLLGAGALVVGLASAGAAQAPQPGAMPLVPGTRVRVSASNLVAPLIANFLQMRGDTAVFIEDAAGRGIWSLLIGDITKIELSQGERRQNRSPILRGALVGAGAGFVAGYAFAAIASPSDASKKYSRPLSAGIAGVVGAAIGGAIGSRFRDENWTNLPLPKRMAIVPGTRGMGVRFGFDF